MSKNKLLKTILTTTNKKTLPQLVNEYAVNEKNWCCYGNVSDTLPVVYWKFLNVENFISNLMNNDIAPRQQEKADFLARYKSDNKLIKEYAKHNKNKISTLFRKIMDIAQPYTEIDDYEEIMIRVSNIVLLCEELDIEVMATEKCPEKDWGIKYFEIDEFATADCIPKIVRKTTIQNFSKIFKNWKWKNKPQPSREQFTIL